MIAALEGGEWSAARPGRTLPPGKTRYPFCGRLGEPLGRSGRAENLVPTGIRSLTVQHVVSRCTDWAIRPTHTHTHTHTHIYIYIYIHIATRCGLDGPGIESRFSAPVQTGPGGPLSLQYNGYRVFPRGKAAGAWRWPPTPSSAEVKERVELYLYPPPPGLRGLL